MELFFALPPDLDRRCFALFLQCDEFENERVLSAVFVTPELMPFAAMLPKSAGNKRSFVLEVKAWLLRNRLVDGRPLLLPLLGALYYDPGDARHAELQALTAAVQNLFASPLTSASPPLRISQTEPATPDRLVIQKPFPLELIRIPAGEFWMGSDTQKDKEAYSDEQPQHKVYVSEFYMGRYPITNAQYAVFAKAQKLKWEKPQGWEQYPAVEVSWHDAVAFCQWLSEETQRQFRLPTEAEWEKAARGPSTGSGRDGRIYPWGDEWDVSKANAENKYGGTTPVGRFSPAGDSVYGVSDMSGNVWEWCGDWWDEKVYEKRKSQVVHDPQGPSDGKERVVRGGAWGNALRFARCAYRYRSRPVFFTYFPVGFRVVSLGSLTSGF